MVSEPDLAFTKALPKAELHAHLSGSISNQTLHEVWLRKQSTLEDPLTAIRPGGNGFVDIMTFFPLFDKYIYALCNDIESVKYATEEVIKAFVEDGVRYLELRTTPRSCEATGMTKEGYVRAVHEVVRRSNETRQEEIEVYLILSIDRSMSVKNAMEVVDLAIKHQCQSQPSSAQRKGGHGFVVGVDLCGNPIKGNVATFTPAFQKAKQSGLGITVHFAEVSQSGTEAELSTILSWEPDRLGHCIHVEERFKDIISSRGIGLELCLSCNVLAGLTTGGFSMHHLGEWLQRKAPIALGTDDLGIFGSPLSAEYALAAEFFRLGQDDLVALSRSAAGMAFAGRERINQRIDAFEKAKND